MKPRRTDPDIVRYTTLSTLRELGRRALFLREQKMRLNTEMRPLIREVAPSLLEVYGVGFDVAAKLLIAAGDNPHRIRSEAAWRTCAASRRSQHRRARSNDTASTAAATDKQTRRSTGSC